MENSMILCRDYISHLYGRRARWLLVTTASDSYVESMYFFLSTFSLFYMFIVIARSSLSFNFIHGRIQMWTRRNRRIISPGNFPYLPSVIPAWIPPEIHLRLPLGISPDILSGISSWISTLIILVLFSRILSGIYQGIL